MSRSDPLIARGALPPRRWDDCVRSPAEEPLARWSHPLLVVSKCTVPRCPWRPPPVGHTRNTQAGQIPSRGSYTLNFVIWTVASPFFRLCPTEERNKVHNGLRWLNCSFNSIFIGVCFCNGSVLWVNDYRYVESQWLKRERNTPPVWMINTSSRWMDTVFAAIYFPGSLWFLPDTFNKKNTWRDGQPANTSYIIIRPTVLEWHMCCTTALDDRSYTNFNNIYIRRRLGNNAGRTNTHPPTNTHTQHILFNFAWTLSKPTVCQI